MSLDHKPHTEQVMPVEPLVEKTPWYQKTAVKIGAGALALVTAISVGIGIGAAGNNSGEGRQEPSAAAPQDPSPEASPTTMAPTPEPTETIEPTTPETNPSDAPISTETEPIYQGLFELPSVEAFQQMSQQERLEAIRLPQPLLERENTQALAAAFFDAEALIYNMFGSDAEYMAYKATGGLHYAKHVIENASPLIEQLQGKLSDADKNDLESVAHALASIHTQRIVNGFTDLFPEYHVRTDLLSAERTPIGEIDVVISMSNTFDETQAELMKELANQEILPSDPTPRERKLVDIHFDKDSQTVQANVLVG